MKKRNNDKILKPFGLAQSGRVQDDKIDISPHPASPCKGEGKIRVAIAMSGGVDSSVAAKLLLDQGYEVVGFMMKLWSEGDLSIEETPSNSPLSRGRENACCDIKGVEDARRVANQLGIPFYLIDAREEFKKHVVDYFIEEYRNLRTPNPCVVCNEKIKFGWLLDFAKKAGCDYLATGHYARIASESPIIKKQSSINNQLTISNNQTNLSFRPRETVGPACRQAGKSAFLKDPSTTLGMTKGDVGMTQGKGGDDKGENVQDDKAVYHLFKAKDENKDQSYFLYGLNQDQLSKILFPIGQFTKPEVREMAKKWGLPVHEKKESQEICFIKEKDFREFLRRHIPKGLFKAGDIVNSQGDIVGKHDGLINYTIGQRRGIAQDRKVDAVIPVKTGIQKNTILDPRVKPEDDRVRSEKQPLYVVGYNVEKNQLIVGEDNEVYKQKMVVGKLVADDSLIDCKNLTVKIRYRHPAVDCKIVSVCHPVIDSEVSNLIAQTRREFISEPVLNSIQESQNEGILKRTQIPKQVRDDIRASVQHDRLLTVRFNEAQRAITPGQSAVFYDGDEILGGGIISQ